MAAALTWCYGPDMSDPERPLREQLDDAIAKVRRELEILMSPSSIGGGSDDSGVIAELEAELRALREARSHVGPHET
jgi:Asp-tRNA(Asn)/Glu-tRNA(Gln) amidotransferase A subunit family amidase